MASSDLLLLGIALAGIAVICTALYMMVSKVDPAKAPKKSKATKEAEEEALATGGKTNRAARRGLTTCLVASKCWIPVAVK